MSAGRPGSHQAPVRRKGLYILNPEFEARAAYIQWIRQDYITHRFNRRRMLAKEVATTVLVLGGSYRNPRRQVSLIIEAAIFPIQCEMSEPYVGCSEPQNWVQVNVMDLLVTGAADNITTSPTTHDSENGS